MKYKTIPENKMSHWHKWELNRWYKIDGELEICRNGFHCSNNFIDAMSFVPPGYVALVEVRGECVKGGNKSVYEEMKIIRWKKWTKKDEIALTIFAAELVLPNKFLDDNRPRTAIEEVRIAAASAAESAAEKEETPMASSSKYDEIIQQCHDFIIERKFK